LWAGPPSDGLLAGLVPKLNSESLYVAIGILGATVMPHNLYLHSALVQTRHIGNSEQAKRRACRYNFVDSVVALNGALLVNAAILVMAAAVFFRRHIVVTEIQQAHLLLAPLLGTSLAGVLFAVALLCSGQSSTLTGTLAGQVVVEGFLNLRVRPWLRRLITRAMAVIPAALTIYFAGEKSTYQLIILSQVILSLQLPFAVIPLIHFTSDPSRMGKFRNSGWVRALSWVTALVIVALNLRLAVLAVAGWLNQAGEWRLLVLLGAIAGGALLLFLLAWVTLEPLISRIHRYGRAPLTLPEPARVPEAPVYHRILVPLDLSPLDRLAISHAAAIAKLHGAKVFLLHVEEGVTSQIYGTESSTAEVEAGAQYLDEIAATLRQQGVAVETAISHSASPRREIVRYAREISSDLVVMGAHGHGGLKDLIFGTTINPVRHNLEMPILIVRPGQS
jgi:manganese transport protein